MSDEGRDGPPTDRASPVGEPVIRGDRALLGERAEEAVEFDPEDPDSVDEAAGTVRAFANDEAGAADSVSVLRGAAACAALVRAEGSYKGAAERATGEEAKRATDEGAAERATGEDGERPATDDRSPSAGRVTVSFVRKWARVHDLPYAVRKHVATGRVAPTAAKHVARLTGDARLLLAWSLLDDDLTVREVRAVASAVNDGADVEAALRDVGVTPGRIAVELPTGTYLALRRRAALADRPPDELVAEALAAFLD